MSLTDNYWDRYYLPTGSYIRVWNAKQEKYCYYWLVERPPAPLRYEWSFRYGGAVAVTPDGERSDTFTFRDLDPTLEPIPHVYMVYLGFCKDTRFHVWQPERTKLIELDEAPEDLTAVYDTVREETEYYTYNDSPLDFPEIYIWIARKGYPAIQPRNVSGASMTPRTLLRVMPYTYTEITTENYPELLDKLEIRQVPSKPVIFGAIR